MNQSNTTAKLWISRLLVLGLAINLIHAVSLLVDMLTENDSTGAVFSWFDNGIIHWAIYWGFGATLFVGAAFSRYIESLIGLGVLLAGLFLMLAGNGGWFIRETDFVGQRFATSLLSIGLLAIAAFRAEQRGFRLTVE